jgi:phage baseplate assembly protein gpV
VIDGTTGKIVERALVSRAGHSVAFSDGDSDSKIKLTTKKGMSMALDDTNTKITISSTGEVSIEGATSLSIKGSDVTIEASQGALTLKGQTGVNISSQAGSVKIDGVQINVSGQGPVAIKGAIVQLN